MIAVISVDESSPWYWPIIAGDYLFTDQSTLPRIRGDGTKAELELQRLHRLAFIKEVPGASLSVSRSNSCRTGRLRIYGLCGTSALAAGRCGPKS